MKRYIGIKFLILFFEGIFTFLILCGCTDNREKLPQKGAPILSANKAANPHVLSVQQLESDTIDIWYGGGVCITFEQGKVLFDFNMQCSYYYPTQIDKDKLKIIWDDNKNCTYDIGVKSTFGINQYPIKGKPFGEFNIINDTLLHINYYFKNWIDKMNEHARKDIDTMFPTTLKMRLKHNITGL